ncbi:MAG: hypothetical protein LBD23_20295 [Oscillospiraceae bacterium]|jgi:2-isopropylmalate synthase|nr:hypothetical protein [Oscillospiraceae bacterium]
MKVITIADISLRESEQTLASKLSFKEKLETAKLLEKLQVDIIETGYVGETPADAAFIRTLATTLEQSVLCVPVSLSKQNADIAWAALTKAKKPRLNVIIPTSTVQMEYQHQMKAEKVLPLVSELVAYCATLCPDVEFTSEDSLRSEPTFLAKVIQTAIEAGAKTITLCDSVGELLPEELTKFINNIYTAVPKLQNITLSLHCKDSIGLASAAVLTGIEAGARLIKVSAGTGYETLSLERFLNVIKLRSEALEITSKINTTALKRTCTQLAALAGVAGTTARVTANETSGSMTDDTELAEDIDIETLRTHITTLGYDVTEDDLQRIYTQFNEISKSKKVVNRDIEALIAETAGQAPPTYILKNYVINSGSAIAATAYIEFTKDNVKSTALSAGDGPIDAAFKAAEQIFGTHYQLEEFQIHAVTGGREATGEALVKLRHNGKLFSGRGVSTDIVGASIRAYLSAVNKIVYEGS